MMNDLPESSPDNLLIDGEKAFISESGYSLTVKVTGRPGMVFFVTFASTDIRENNKKYVSIVKEIGSEVFVVDLSRPDIPFPAVRVLATRLPPRLNADFMRLADRFSEVPVKLGFRKQPVPISDIKLWAICGYR
jgi:hypothetical protein